MNCFDDNAIVALLRRGELGAAHVQEHIDGCPSCRTLLASAIRLSPLAYGDQNNEPTLPLAELEDEGSGAAPLFPGDTVDHRYVIEERLGEGGMSVVWAARRSDTGQRVALKVLRANDPETLARVKREALIAERLSHPNIVRVHEVLLRANRAILVMDLLSGTTLRRKLQERATRFSEQEAARFFLPVISTLDEAHAKHVIHRDLKPENIFESDGGQVFVLDFGVARVLPSMGASSKLTRSGTVLGTPRYMAPEQIFGERIVDARADIWSLGIMLYECLSGSHPLSASSMGEIMRFMQAPRFESITRVVPTLSPDTATLVMRSLSRDPQKRPSAEEFLPVFSRAATP